MDQIDTNNGELIFSTEGSGTLSTVLTLDSNQNTIVSGPFWIQEYIYHHGDADTYIRALPNEWILRTGGSDRLTISDSNTYFTNTSVGIGTTSPSYGLDVESSSDSVAGVYIQAGKSSQGEIQNTGLIVGSRTDMATNDYLGISFTGNAATPARGRAAIGVKSTNGTSAMDLVFMTRNAADGSQLGSADEKMRIDSSGNVSIARTTANVGGAPSGTDGRFNVYTNVGSSAWAQQMRHDSTTGNGLFIRAGASSSYYTAYFAGYDESNVHFVVKGDGKVGIGTASPSKQLMLYGNTPFIRLEDSQGGSKRLDLWVDSNAVAHIDANQSAQQITFRTASTDRLRITNAGNVGIGTTSPAEKLVVAGNIKANDVDGKFYTNVYVLAASDTFVNTVTVTGTCLYEYTIAVNPNTAGSSAYVDYYYGKVGIGIGWNGSAVTQYIFQDADETAPRSL